MRKLSGIVMNDGVNKYNERFTLSAIYNAYLEGFDRITPFYFNHNHRYLLGYTRFSGLYLEPGRAYLLNQISEHENNSEELEVQKILLCEKKRRMYEDTNINILLEKIRDKLVERPIYFETNCTAIYNEGIVKRMFPNLIDKFDKSGLISIKELEYITPGLYKMGDFILFAHQYFRRDCYIDNSINEKLIEKLENLSKTNSVKIALDINLIGLYGTQSYQKEYQYWWGPKFDEDLSKIPEGVTVHLNDKNKSSAVVGLYKTEFGWYTQDNSKTFECEEVVDISNIEHEEKHYMGCRFVHSMLDSDSGKPVHLDGAIRAYTEEELLERIDQDIKKIGRHTVYTKLWRIDGEISVSDWKALINDYYRDNHLIGEYFNGKDEKLINNKSNPKNISNQKNAFSEYLLETLPLNSGLRICFSFCNNRVFSGDVMIESDIMLAKEEKELIQIVEEGAFSLVKWVKDKIHNVHMNDFSIVCTNDLIVNFPIFVCKDCQSANLILDGLKEFCSRWYSNNENRLLSFIIEIQDKDISYSISLAGYVKDFLDYFCLPDYYFPKDYNFLSWVEKSYHFLNNYSDTSLNPNPITSSSFNDNIIRFRRVILDVKISEINGNIVYQPICEIEDKNRKKIEDDYDLEMLILIENCTCKKCGEDYKTCDCITFLDDSVSYKADKCKILGAYYIQKELH